jgi:hypothetical protein
MSVSLKKFGTDKYPAEGNFCIENQHGTWESH